jgi:putative transposase
VDNSYRRAAALENTQATVEQHSIDRHDPRFALIDPACFASKNLYNAGLYILRQAFFSEGDIPSYAKLAHSLKDTTEFRALPAKVAQWTRAAGVH